MKPGWVAHMGMRIDMEKKEITWCHNGYQGEIWVRVEGGKFLLARFNKERAREARKRIEEGKADGSENFVYDAFYVEESLKLSYMKGIRAYRHHFGWDDDFVPNGRKPDSLVESKWEDEDEEGEDDFVHKSMSITEKDMELVGYLDFRKGKFIPKIK